MINELYDKYFPLKTRVLTKKAQSKPWINQALVNRIKIRDKLGKLANKGRINRDTYKRFRNILTQQIRESKSNYFNAQFDNCKNNIKKTWKIINNTTKKGKLANKTILCENENIIDSKDVPNMFIDYFSNIANQLVSEIPPTEITAESYLSNTKYSSFFMFPKDNQEVESAIMNLKNSGSGVYKVSALVLKDVKCTVSTTLSTIFNLCIEHGHFPDELKIGCITPVFKKGDKTNKSNYRPICSLSPFSKIFERIIYDRMLKFID